MIISAVKLTTWAHFRIVAIDLSSLFLWAAAVPAAAAAPVPVDVLSLTLFSFYLVNVAVVAVLFALI